MAFSSSLMALNSSSKAKSGYTPFFKSDGTPLTKAERSAANKAKWAADQKAKSKTKAKSDDKLTRAERSVINKAKFAEQQAAKRKEWSKAKAAKAKTKTKAKSAPAPKPATIKVKDVKNWMSDNPRRKQFTAIDITDWMAQPKSKTAKTLDRKGKSDSGLSKRDNRLEVQAQYIGGNRA